MNFRSRGTSMAVTSLLLLGGAAVGQTLASDVPQSTYVVAPSPVSNDAPAISAVLNAAKYGDGVRIRAGMAGLHDPLSRKIAIWALADSAPDSLSWAEADYARRELADWPRPQRRQAAAEKLIELSGLSPKAVIAWFGNDAPTTPEGAMALASALRAQGQNEAATQIIRAAWRGEVFDQATQATMLSRFHDMLDVSDYVAREDFLLYGPQGPAAADILPLLPADQIALAQARMAVRRDDPIAPTLIAALPAASQNSPGLIYERILAAQSRGDTTEAMALAPYLPSALPPQAAERLWKHGALVTGALKAGNFAGAYAAAAHSGLVSGSDAADAEFYAGWLALSHLKDPRKADEHFARLQAIGKSPLTQSRALYWRGRAAEAEGDPVAAQLYYAQAARHYTTFYGQLAATRGGPATLELGRDPDISSADRSRFEARDEIRAARLMAQMGARDAYKSFVAGLADTLQDPASEAMLVDLVRGQGDQELSMRVVRNAAKRGFILPERGYPVRTVGDGAPEPSLVLGVTRQESSFDPLARSGAGARGMMQLMPATAQVVARRSGLGVGSLDDPDYNIKVGSTYLGQLIDQFSGSYVMATAAYNAGPGRPVQWVGQCGDPRSSTSDPLDFIECIPFSETRDYVMRVMEAAQVYRARLNGGKAPITLAADLKRGAYHYQAHAYIPASPAQAAPSSVTR